MWLQDSGILKKFVHDELRAPIPIPLPKLKVNQPLSISQLATIFLFATFGILVSIMAFLAEIFRAQKGKAKNTNPQVTGHHHQKDFIQAKLFP